LRDFKSLNVPFTDFSGGWRGTRHFLEAVNHYELGRDAEQLHRLS